MKKILSVVLAVLLIFSAVSIGAIAGNEEKVPVVILQGYSGPDLDMQMEMANLLLTKMVTFNLHGH